MKYYSKTDVNVVYYQRALSETRAYCLWYWAVTVKAESNDFLPRIANRTVIAVLIQDLVLDTILCKKKKKNPENVEFCLNTCADFFFQCNEAKQRIAVILIVYYNENLENFNSTMVLKRQWRQFSETFHSSFVLFFLIILHLELWKCNMASINKQLKCYYLNPLGIVCVSLIRRLFEACEAGLWKNSLEWEKDQNFAFRECHGT